MTIAVVGAGGLEPTKVEEISIEREDLYISPDRVRVHYIFRNASERGIIAPVLFPLPEIDAYRQSDDSFVAAIERDEGPAIGVSVKVGGHPLEVKARQRAYSRDGTEITGRLVRHGLTLVGAHNMSAALKNLLPKDVDALTADGLIILDTLSSTYSPNWTVRGEYMWKQTFPANSTIEVSIEYKPLTGGIYWHNFSLSNDDIPSSVEADISFYANKWSRSPWPERYCVNAGHLDALSQLTRTTTEDSGVSVFWTRYILVSALNWAGAIGTFHLTVDTQNSHAVAAFCAPDGKAPIRKTGPTTSEVTIEQFVPRENFSLVVIDPTR